MELQQKKGNGRRCLCCKIVFLGLKLREVGKTLGVSEPTVSFNTYGECVFSLAALWVKFNLI